MVFSNFRVDHTEFLGKDREQIARSMLDTVPSGTLTFIPEEEFRPWMENLALKKGFELRTVASSQESAALAEILPYPEFEINARLALAVLKHFGLSAGQARPGWSVLNPDSGRPRLWKIRTSRDRSFYFVSLFAANDPESSLMAMELIIAGWAGRKVEKSGC